MSSAAGKIPDWIKAGLSHPFAAAAALSLGLRLGHEVYSYAQSELSDEDAPKKLGQHLGAVTGTLIGAAAGALVPGAGKSISVFAGALLGHIAGEHAGRRGAERFVRKRQERRAGSSTEKS